MKEGQYPWLPLFVADWLSSETVTLGSLAARGALIHLLCYQWKDGSIPADEVRIARLLGASPEEFKSVWKEIGSKFKPFGDDRLQNERLEFERAKRQGRSSAAKESASRRWENPNEEAPKEDKPKTPKKTKPVDPPKKEDPPKEVNPNTPFAKIERVLTKVSERLNGSTVQRRDVIRYLPPESHINLLLELFPEEQVVAMYVHAANTWNGGVSWAGVHSQRDAINTAMKRPAGRPRGGKETAEEKYQRLQVGAA